MVLALMVATGCVDSDGDRCEIRTCGVDVAADRATNGRLYESCSSGPAETTLVDDGGEAFFACVESSRHSCIDTTVDAQLAYCEVAPTPH